VRILIINYRYYVSGGPERYLFNIKSVLEKNGHEVFPFSVKSRRNVPTKYEKYFVDPIGNQDLTYFREYKKTARVMIDVIVRLFYSKKVKRKLELYIDKFRPDVAYVLQYYNKLSPSVLDACKKKGIPAVVRLSDYALLCPQAHFLCHGQICEKCIEEGYHSCLKKKCINGSLIGSFLKFSAIVFHRKVLNVFASVDSFVCTTRFMAEKMIKGRFEKKKLVVIPTFFDTEASTHKENRSIREEYVRYFGRLVEEKAIDILLGAYANSMCAKKGIKLVIVGGTMKDLSWMDLTISNKEYIDRNIVFIDFVQKSELYNYIENCLFVIHPSRWYENLPNTILEAYKFNKPVITANLGSLPEVVIHGKTGFLYNDDLDLVERINTLICDKALRSTMSSNIAVVKETYRSDKHYSALKRLFSEAITRSGG